MRSSRVLRSRLRQRVLVTLKDGAAFDGVLFDQDDRAIVLRDSSAVGAGENRTNLPLDGEVILLLPDISYMQRT